MLANSKNFIKILKSAQSCETEDQAEIVFNWANKFRRSFRLTEFEYIEIEQVIIDKFSSSERVSKWNSDLTFKEIIKK